MFRKKYIFISITILLVIYLITSNLYMYKFFDTTTEHIKQTELEKNKIVSYLEPYKSNFVWILSNTVKNGIGSVNLSGGFYDKEVCEKVSHDDMLLFLMGNKSYVIESIKAFSPFMSRDNNLTGSCNGFASNFSSFIIQDGIYSFGIQAKDGSIIKTSTRKIYKKNNNMLMIAYDLDSEESRSLAKYIIDNSSNVELAISPVLKRIDKNLYNLYALLYIKNKQIDSYDSGAFIKITTESESKIYRVPLSYNEWMHKNIGSYARVSSANINFYINDFDEVKIEYMILNNNKVYTHKKVDTYRLENNQYQILGNITTKPIESNEDFNVLYNEMILNNYLGIDANGDNYVFRGVSYIPENESKQYEIFVRILNDTGNKLYKIEHKYSDWVARNVGVKYAYSHIWLPLSKEQLSNNGVIKLYLKNGDNYYTTGREYIYNFENNKYSIK